MKGFVIAEAGHVVQALAPVDINGGIATSDVWSMEEYAHATIIVMLGVTGAASTVTVEQCDDFVPTTHPAIAFAHYDEATAAGDTLGARTAAAVGGFATGLADGIFYVIEVDASELAAGYPNMRVSMSDPGVQTFAAILVILSGSRYGEVESPTAIA